MAEDVNGPQLTGLQISILTWKTAVKSQPVPNDNIVLKTSGGSFNTQVDLQIANVAMTPLDLQVAPETIKLLDTQGTASSAVFALPIPLSPGDKAINLKFAIDQDSAGGILMSHSYAVKCCAESVVVSVRVNADGELEAWRIRLPASCKTALAVFFDTSQKSKPVSMVWPGVKAMVLKTISEESDSPPADH